ncbi:MAG: hypothetical protein RM368_26405 [Nostoc sp. DedSLP03]|uniref:hypothetical protein n=1 Tax=Nostoc sp. DedSLP03 TaxID=3075400 RepID=UPI002AD2DBEA|nr:hypothetical protein [Nostoc sp. DedSLP03]MDZ7968440.1 hypothetical protein [Nostoc sp. DedSLP03]
MKTTIAMPPLPNTLLWFYPKLGQKGQDIVHDVGGQDIGSCQILVIIESHAL